MDANIIMSRKETRYAEVLPQVISGSLSRKEAAELLSISLRHLRRLEERFEDGGIAGLAHQSRGEPGNRKLPAEEKENILTLLKSTYADFGPTFATEKLKEDHRIARDPKTIRSLMIEADLWQPKRRRKETHRAWRERRACFGELVQYDGSYEHWFEDRGEKCCLLAAIDDATSRVTQAVFADHEGVEPTFRFWETYVRVQGKPKALYVDKFSTYSMNHKLAKENGDTKTQFERAMHTLGVEIITANSSQAKGRVERLFKTLQDRLIKELRLQGISTKEAANMFLKDTFLPAFNMKFSVVAREEADLHIRITKQEEASLPSVFSRHAQRVVRNDFTLAYKNAWYQLSEAQPVTVFHGESVTVEERPDGSIRFRLKGKYLSTSKLPVRPEKVKALPRAISRHTSYTPAADHPWRKFDFAHH